MTALDGILAILAIIALTAFLAVLVIYVPQPALTVICAATVLMAAFDFIREFRIARRNGMEKR